MSMYRSSWTSSSRPIAPRIWRAVSRCGSLTSGVAIHTLMPWPICAGVLGMTRMIRSHPVSSRNRSMRTPAAMDRNGPLTGLGVRRAESASMCCGFRATIFRPPESALFTASALSATVVTPCFSDSAARRSASISPTTISSGLATPFSMMAVIIASAITPPPMNAISATSVEPPMAKYSGLSPPSFSTWRGIPYTG